MTCHTCHQLPAWVLCRHGGVPFDKELVASQFSPQCIPCQRTPTEMIGQLAGWAALTA
jgi:hypothetical protein